MTAPPGPDRHDLSIQAGGVYGFLGPRTQPAREEPPMQPNTQTANR